MQDSVVGRSRWKARTQCGFTPRLICRDQTQEEYRATRGGVAVCPRSSTSLKFSVLSTQVTVAIRDPRPDIQPPRLSRLDTCSVWPNRLRSSVTILGSQHELGAVASICAGILTRRRKWSVDLLGSCVNENGRSRPLPDGGPTQPKRTWRS